MRLDQRLGALEAGELTRGAFAQLEPCLDAARQLQQGGLLVELVALRALLLLDGGEFDEATVVARRAARMAQSEKQLRCEQLSRLVLARVRRHTGRPTQARYALSTLNDGVCVPQKSGRTVDYKVADTVLTGSQF